MTESERTETEFRKKIVVGGIAEFEIQPDITEHTENKAKTDPGLYLAAAEINELRRKLVSELSEKRAAAPERRSLPMPNPPQNVQTVADPRMIFQVLTAEQLTPELAQLKPAYLYVPAAVMAENPSLLAPYVERGTVPVAVLPRISPMANA